ncbi:hypothetical protein ACT4YY_16665 [Acinetobacter baumannii]|uniref:hypothetical protein n=1 Tax=Acinetobacter baumannii TaxID=470 RepID=UPI001C0D6238|nr:hypothetical protein [Acinetobacter baumannii]MBU3082498.1 hypothetical protein [Acinetobacter baumannii]MDC5116118.1 hypothetical protein [Acinetobacter baumannii]
MSELAVTEIGGKIDTAWSFRAEFLNYGTVYINFFCPFCNIRLAGCNIDTIGEIVRSPHFKCFPNQKHLNGCDGTPIFINNEQNKIPSSKFQPITMKSYPEALVARRTPRQTDAAILNVPAKIPTPEEIQNYRKKVGSRGRIVPSSSLLKPFVEARNSVIRDGHHRFSDQKQKSDPWDWIKKVWSEMPLLLEDQTNYEDAFRKPKYVNFYKKRIYNSKGKIFLEDGNFIVQGTEYIKKGQKNIDVKLVIDVRGINRDSPQAHKKMLEWLHQLANITADVDWYAYGMPQQYNNKNFSLSIENIDHIYIKKQYAAK